MKLDSKLWTLSPRVNSVNNALFVSSSGGIYYYTANVTNSILPSVFIDSSITIVSGDGTDPDHAYVLQ